MRTLFAADLHTIGVIGWKVPRPIPLGGTFAISPHGVGIAIGYLCGFDLHAGGAKRGSRRSRSARWCWGLVGSIVGARVGYVLAHLSQFNSFADMLAIYRGGISLVGASSAGSSSRFPSCAAAISKALDAFDAAAMPLAVGIVIGRIGDLIIGDHLGKPTSWPLAWQYHGGNLAGYDCSSGRAGDAWRRSPADSSR
jgi:phosphatidylglycerol:prolipoprotein diacylglycerol transferase